MMSETAAGINQGKFQENGPGQHTDMGKQGHKGLLWAPSSSLSLALDRPPQPCLFSWLWCPFPQQLLLSIFVSPAGLIATSYVSLKDLVTDTSAGNCNHLFISACSSLTVEHSTVSG